MLKGVKSLVYNLNNWTNFLRTSNVEILTKSLFLFYSSHNIFLAQYFSLLKKIRYIYKRPSTDIP